MSLILCLAFAQTTDNLSNINSHDTVAAILITLFICTGSAFMSSDTTLVIRKFLHHLLNARMVFIA